MLMIDHDKCTACGLCVKNCPFGAAAFVDGQLVQRVV